MTDTAIECPLCGVTVTPVSSATLSLALWQHVNWACPGVEALVRATLSLPAPATDTASAALLKVMRWEVTGRYGGITQWKEHPTGTWVRWEDLEAALASLPAPAAPEGLRAKLQAFVDRERALRGPRMGQSVGYQPSITPSVLKVLERMLASAPAAPVIVVQVPDGWRVAQWDGQRYVSIGLPYPTERQANGDCALILARVQPTVESRLP